MTGRRRPYFARWRDRPGLLVAAVLVTLMCWILGNPRSSGPDEPTHMIASAGLVRGDRSGRINPNPLVPHSHLVEVPGMVGQPDPGCWAFQSDVPVACASTQPLTTTSRELPMNSYNYPPWAYVPPGLASFIPSAGGYAYLARLFNAAIPIALMAASLVTLARQRSVAAASALLGLTPIAWFTLGVVNPSAMAIGGGLALWTGLLFHEARTTSMMLTVGGWASVLLARRDGPMWVVLIVITCCVLLSMRPLQLWVRLDRWARWTLVGITPLALVTPSINRDAGRGFAMGLAPVALLGVELVARAWVRFTSAAARVTIAVGATLVAAAGATMFVVGATASIDAGRIRVVMSGLGEHLRQLVGILGWLDTPVPQVAVFLFWAILGGLAMTTALEFRRSATVFLASLGAAIVVAWLLELGQAVDLGAYQGRYTMPFAVGLPLVLTWRPAITTSLSDRLTPIVAVSSWVIGNVAFVAAQQRWGVGVNGSWSPWRWDTWGAPLQPWVLILVHGGSTAALAWCCSAQRVSSVGVTRDGLGSRVMS